MRRLRCFLGFHEWRRSRFVVLGQRVADFNCVHCMKWRDGERPTILPQTEKGS